MFGKDTISRRWLGLSFIAVAMILSHGCRRQPAPPNIEYSEDQVDTIRAEIKEFDFDE